MRFAWNFDGYAARERWGPLLRTVLPPLVARVRRWDLRTAHRPTMYAANSSAGAARIRRHYGRPAAVVFPPVEVERFSPLDADDDYHLVVSRLVPYKRVDLVVDAFNRLARPLVVIGDGPARRDLERQAGPTIRFLGRQPDDQVAAYYARCRALVFPGEEDFGLTPLEANASGRPVIAYRAGGALDTVVDGMNGVFFDTQTVESLCEAIARCDALPWDKARLRRHAEGFREDVFRERFMAVVRSALARDADLEQERRVRDADVERRRRPQLLDR
jgi:glycosyltransferase involved in cell wall biosynthesis